VRPGGPSRGGAGRGPRPTDQGGRGGRTGGGKRREIRKPRTSGLSGKHFEEALRNARKSVTAIVNFQILFYFVKLTFLFFI
jgi:hypothetical protein